MFGMGFMEILLIAVIAIIALGPDKLPTAMVEIAKFIRKFKSGIEDAKSTLDNELNIKEMKEEANKFKAQIEDAKSTVSIDTKIDLGLDNIINDDLSSKKEEKPKDEKVSFKKKESDKIKTVEDINEEIIENTANKFKVNFDEKKQDNI